MDGKGVVFAQVYSYASGVCCLASPDPLVCLFGT